MKNIETRFQELLLFCAISIIGANILTGLIYILASDAFIVKLLGQVGSQYIATAFNWLGLGFFIPAICTFFFAKYCISYTPLFVDYIKSYKNLIRHLFFYTVSVAYFCSLLSIAENYLLIKYSQKLLFGSGGNLGLLIGGKAYIKIGLLGALFSTTLSYVVIGVSTGHIHLINMFYSAFEGLKKSFQLSAQGIKHLHKQFNVSIEKKKVRQRLKEIEESRLLSNVAFGTMSEASYYQQAVGSDSNVAVDDVTDSENIPRTEPTLIPVEGKSPTTEQKAPKKKRAKKKLVKKEPTLALVDDLEEELEKTPEEISKENQQQFAIEHYTKRYPAPTVNLLQKETPIKSLNKVEQQKLSELLIDRLESFGVRGKIVAIHSGARLTLFEFMPASGVKLSKIQALSTDLALLLGAESIRLLTPIPGKTTVGIEVPNPSPSAVSFKSIYKSLNKGNKNCILPVPLGMNVYNETSIGDLSKMPHLLVSGATGSGKSVFTNSLISGLVFSKSPKDLRMIMIDPKMIELTPYNGIPHLMKPVISDPSLAKDALVWAEGEMDRRYQVLAKIGARNIESFNSKIVKTNSAKAKSLLGDEYYKDYSFPMPYIVVIVDELADLMMTQGKDVEIPITRIAQKARACGIHLVLATQRPSAEIVTGLIKANFPTRIAFKVSSSIDSRTILDQSGAEKLLGNGDMLYLPNGKPMERIQGAFISEEEVSKIVKHIS